VVQFVFPKEEEVAVSVQGKLFKAQTYIKHSLSVIETKQLMNTLRESSLVDSLTGLYNRRFLQDHSTQIISGVLRRKKQIALLMCDMDYFKQVNDEHGHDVGDTLLKETSRILQGAIRESDVVIRFGGEEFLILLVDVELGEGMVVAEKIRKKVEETSFKIPSGVLKKTLSVGVCEFPNDTDGFWHAIKFADVALYQAKTQGRNRCVRFREDMWDQAGGF
jgi:diguanylate cyclase (GGDEF)-like protein